MENPQQEEGGKGVFIFFVFVFILFVVFYKMPPKIHLILNFITCDATLKIKLFSQTVH